VRGSSANLELVLEEIFFVGEFAIQAEEALFVGGEFLCAPVSVGLFVVL
jgi:hypothetical protein